VRRQRHARRDAHAHPKEANGSDARGPERRHDDLREK
jgi:hypothetical protein